MIHKSQLEPGSRMHARDPAKQPTRILLAWAHGRNLEHLSRLGATAGLLAQSGSEVAWAVPAAHLDATQIGDRAQWCGASAQTAALPMPADRVPARSFAEVLAAHGFADEENLRRHVSALAARTINIQVGEVAWKN
jgi:hypothetical protein